MGLGIDIKVDSRQVRDAKQHIEMLNRSLNDTHALGDLSIGEDGLPLASQRIKEMAEQVRRLQALSRQGTTKGGVLDSRQFQEANEHMRRLNASVQDYAKTITSVRNEMKQLAQAQAEMRRNGQASTPEFRENRSRLRQLQDERRELEAQEQQIRKLGAQGSAAASDVTGMGLAQQGNGWGGLKKALGWGLAAAGGFSLLGFLAQSRAKFQQSAGSEVTLGARGITGGYGDGIGMGIGPLEQMALLESISQTTGLSGRRANHAANMSGAFGRYTGLDPSLVSSIYGTMYSATGNADLGGGAIGMMGEAIKKGMDKARMTELLTLVNRNTQVTAQAMGGAGASPGQAGAGVALAVEALLASQHGASYGQFAKSQEFMNVMQNGLQGAGTGAGDIRLFQAMGGFDGPMSWKKIHQLNLMKEGGFLQNPQLLTKIIGGLDGSAGARAGQLETMFASWGVKGKASEEMIKMFDDGFLGRLTTATKNGKVDISSLSKGDQQRLKEFQAGAPGGAAMERLKIEAGREQTQIKAGDKLSEAFAKLEDAALDAANALLDTSAVNMSVSAMRTAGDFIHDNPNMTTAILGGAAGLWGVNRLKKWGVKLPGGAASEAAEGSLFNRFMSAGKTGAGKIARLGASGVGRGVPGGFATDLVFAEEAGDSSSDEIMQLMNSDPQAYQKLQSLSPDMRGKVARLIKRMRPEYEKRGLKLTYGDTIRSLEAQQKAIQEGKSRLRDPRYSKHIADRKGFSNAIDLYGTKNGKIVDLPMDLYEMQKNAIAHEGLGGGWKWDKGHIENTKYNPNPKIQDTNELADRYANTATGFIQGVLQPIIEYLHRIAENTSVAAARNAQAPSIRRQ